jgi:hypothetical protein
MWPINSHTGFYNNGYYVISGYPYMIHNGYRFRYSNYDYCNYQLIDKYNHQVINSFWNMRCNQGYDICANQRDNMNYQAREFRYVCAETYRDRGHNFNDYSYNYNHGGDQCYGQNCYDDYYDFYY